MFPKKCVCVYMYMTHIYMTRDEIQGMNEKRMGWQAGKREALVKALTTASLTASHNLKPLLKTPTIESVAIVQFMVLRFPRLLTRCHTLAKNCQLLEYAGVATARKVVQRHISLRFVWFQFQYASLPLCAEDTLEQIWSYVSTYFTNESDFPHHYSFLYGGSHQAIIGKCKNNFNFDCG